MDLTEPAVHHSKNLKIKVKQLKTLAQITPQGFEN